MKAEVAKREIESLDYYLQNHTNDYSEESHTAMMMAIQALGQEPKSEWEHDHEILKAYSDGASAVLESIKCLIKQYEHYLELLDADMKDGSATIVTKTKYAVYAEVVEQLKEVLESEDKA